MSKINKQGLGTKGTKSELFSPLTRATLIIAYYLGGGGFGVLAATSNNVIRFGAILKAQRFLISTMATCRSPSWSWPIRHSFPGDGERLYQLLLTGPLPFTSPTDSGRWSYGFGLTHVCLFICSSQSFSGKPIIRSRVGNKLQSSVMPRCFHLMTRHLNIGKLAWSCKLAKPDFPEKSGSFNYYKNVVIDFIWKSIDPHVLTVENDTFLTLTKTAKNTSIDHCLKIEICRQMLYTKTLEEFRHGNWKGRQSCPPRGGYWKIEKSSCWKKEYENEIRWRLMF